MEAQRRRHHYGTTGCRLHLAVDAALPVGSVVYTRNPDAVPDTEATTARTAIMGDIVSTSGDRVTISVKVEGHCGIEKVELRDGANVLETVRPYQESDLGERIRVIWAGAEYRGRGRDTLWAGHANFRNAEITRFAPVNHWNTEQMLDQRGSETVSFRTVTTGNFMGFDVWLDAEPDAELKIDTNRGQLNLPAESIGIEPRTLDAGGLARRLTVQRLPSAPLASTLSFEREVNLADGRDTPVWVAVTMEDGHQAWSSPIYFFRNG